MNVLTALLQPLQPLLLLLFWSPLAHGNALWPRIHFTPPCFQHGGPHDIAGALYLQQQWHVMTYCFDGHWQHIVSDDLVAWRLAQPTPTMFGGTGGMLLEEPGKVVVYAATGSARHAKHCPACPAHDQHSKKKKPASSCSWKCPTNAGCACPRAANCSQPSEWSCQPTSNCAFYVNTSADLTTWAQDNHTSFPPSNDTNCDRVWRDSKKWWAFTAGRVGGYSPEGSKGAQENFYANKGSALYGPQAQWTALHQPFLTNNHSVVIAGHPQRSEFVSADYFQHLPSALPGASSSEASGVFLFHTYGGKSSVNASAYNYGVFASGSQPEGAGTPFVPTRFSAFDYSCFVPSEEAENGLEIATSHGVTQFGWVVC
jgi:hypothetical protein